MRRIQKGTLATISLVALYGDRRCMTIAARWVGRLVALTIVCAASQAGAWGDEGHQIVALIAQPFLTPAAAHQVSALLANDPDVTMPEASTWADRIKLQRPETRPWHFIDIPLQVQRLDMTRDCAGNTCVIAQLQRLLLDLTNSQTAAVDQTEALKFVVHFIGDLHQPLHCEDNHDHGGNDVKVRYFSQPDNLHHVWDTVIIAHIDSDVTLHADRLLRSIRPADKERWSQGSIVDWTNEAHALARSVAYARLPPGMVKVLGDAYEQASESTIELQLKRAGVRLAKVLNDALQ